MTSSSSGATTCSSRKTCSGTSASDRLRRDALRLRLGGAAGEHVARAGRGRLGEQVRQRGELVGASRRACVRRTVTARPGWRRRAPRTPPPAPPRPGGGGCRGRSRRGTPRTRRSVHSAAPQVDEERRDDGRGGEHERDAGRGGPARRAVGPGQVGLAAAQHDVADHHEHVRHGGAEHRHVEQHRALAGERQDEAERAGHEQRQHRRLAAVGDRQRARQVAGARQREGLPRVGVDDGEEAGDQADEAGVVHQRRRATSALPGRGERVDRRVARGRRSASEPAAPGVNTSMSSASTTSRPIAARIPRGMAVAGSRASSAASGTLSTARKNQMANGNAAQTPSRP